VRSTPDKRIPSINGECLRSFRAWPWLSDAGSASDPAIPRHPRTEAATLTEADANRRAIISPLWTGRPAGRMQQRGTTSSLDGLNSKPRPRGTGARDRTTISHHRRGRENANMDGQRKVISSGWKEHHADTNILLNQSTMRNSRTR